MPIRVAGDRIRDYFGAPRLASRAPQYMVEIDPTNGWAHSNTANALARQGKCIEALKEINKAEEAIPRNVGMTLLGTRVHLTCGDRAAALRAFARAKALPNAHDQGLGIAIAFQTFGQIDSAFVWLDSTHWDAQQRWNFRTNKGFDSLRADPRYGAALHRMGLQ